MQQKHVITHPDQAGRTRSRQNQNYPEKYFRVTILFSYGLQLLCVCYYRSPPEIVYLKCYCQFIFFFNLLIINFTFYFIFVYFSNFRGSKNRGSMDQGSMFCTFPARGHETKHVCEILNIFVLLDKFFCLILNENLLLLNFPPRFFHLVAFI